MAWKDRVYLRIAWWIFCAIRKYIADSKILFLIIFYKYRYRECGERNKYWKFSDYFENTEKIEQILKYKVLFIFYI